MLSFFTPKAEQILKSVNTQKALLKTRSRIALNKWAGIRLNVHFIQGLLKFNTNSSHRQSAAACVGAKRHTKYI